MNHRCLYVLCLLVKISATNAWLNDNLYTLAPALGAYYMKDPTVGADYACFAKTTDQQILQFVIDIAPSPAADVIDTRISLNPIQRLLGGPPKDPSEAYYDAIEMFINDAGIGVKEELVFAVIMDQGQQYFIRGRKTTSPPSDNSEAAVKNTDWKALYPKATNFTDAGAYSQMWTNNLGRLVSLALKNRDNGLPTVLKTKIDEKLTPFFTIIITDGSSNSTLSELTDDISNTVILDVAAGRFISKLTTREIREVAGVIHCDCLLKLNLAVRTARFLACQLGLSGAN